MATIGQPGRSPLRDPWGSLREILALVRTWAPLALALFGPPAAVVVGLEWLDLLPGESFGKQTLIGTVVWIGLVAMWFLGSVRGKFTGADTDLPEGLPSPAPPADATTRQDTKVVLPSPGSRMDFPAAPESTRTWQDSTMVILRPAAPKHVRLGFVALSPPENAKDSDVLAVAQTLEPNQVYYLRVDITSQTTGSNVQSHVAIPPDVLRKINAVEVHVSSDEFLLTDNGEYASIQLLPVGEASAFIFVRCTAPAAPCIATLNVEVFRRQTLVQRLQTRARVVAAQRKEVEDYPLPRWLPLKEPLGRQEIRSLRRLTALAQPGQVALEAAVAVDEVRKAQQLVLELLALGNTSRVDYTIRSDLTRADDFDDVQLHITFDGAAGKVSAKGRKSPLPPACDVTVSSLRNGALKSFRDLMSTINETAEGKYAFAPFNKGAADRLPKRMEALAKQGNQLFLAVFTTAKIKEYIRNELREPATIDIAQLGEQATVPWSALYDLPLMGENEAKSYDPPGHTVCSRWADAKHQQRVPGSEDARRLDAATCRACADCPLHPNEGEDPEGESYEVRTHRLICVFGFWGFKHRLQIPPGSCQEVSDSSLPREIFAAYSPALTLVAHPKIAESETHIDKLKALKFDGRAVQALTPNNYVGIRQSLRQSSLLIVYFYCHGDVTGTTPRLIVGERDKDNLVTISAVDLDGWKVKFTPPALVFINGCETVTYTPENLTSLALQFRGCEAAGVIGTEIKVFPPLARWFGEEFLRRFLDHQTVGEIMLELRQELLQKNNPLGLIYTSYSLAGLHIVR